MTRNGRRTTTWCMLAAALLVMALMLAAAPVGGAGGVRYVDKQVARNCQGKTPCYQSIQAAVNDAQPGDTVYVFPATYAEGVNLNNMDPQGNISLITVDANGNPTPGTVTVDNPGDAPEIYTGDPLLPFNGDVTIDGFVLRSDYGAIHVWVNGGVGGAEGGDAAFVPDGEHDVVIRNVDASHTGGDGITVRAGGNITIEDCTTNDNDGYGIGVMCMGGDVTITGCTSNDNKGPSVTAEGSILCQAGGICVSSIAGQITIRDNTANGNGSEGILVGPLFVDGEETVSASVTTPDTVIVDECTANNNDSAGIAVFGTVGDVTITNCTTNGNGEDGVVVRGGLFGDEAGVDRTIDDGDVIIRNCTSNGNDEAGFDPEYIYGTLSIQACIARDNEAGVDLDNVWSGSVLVNGSVICGNECGVYLDGGDLQLGNGPGIINLEGNWWGCAEGPEAAGCDPICEGEVDSIAVDFTPWISKISDTATVDPVMAGQPTEVSFQFSGNPSAVYLGQGPGDLRGPGPFTVSTDNGTLNGIGATVQEFINAADGTLKVTLVPARGGTATVTVSGPCGLDEGIVLGVESEFVPEPGTVVLLASGLMGLAGYAGLRKRRR